ncbi:helix-turn-helix domain-containing protein [Mycolicibacterium parafortuitum]|uniref:helix-turn-helix domain-containing protein n=1 Tax=Mycolicibacterium parafortuitum TaxID=39692 RepID=UPI0032C3F355
MGIFEELAEEYGVGAESPEAQLAEDLAAADDQFMRRLVELRRDAGLTQEDLGQAWGRHKTAVSQFERPGADPRLSTIRRYAASIGARYYHNVRLDPRVHRRLKLHEAFDAVEDWLLIADTAPGRHRAIPTTNTVRFSVEVSARTARRKASEPEVFADFAWANDDIGDD